MNLPDYGRKWKICIYYNGAHHVSVCFVKTVGHDKPGKSFLLGCRLGLSCTALSCLVLLCLGFPQFWYILIFKKNPTTIAQCASILYFLKTLCSPIMTHDQWCSVDQKHISVGVVDRARQCKKRQGMARHRCAIQYPLYWMLLPLFWYVASFPSNQSTGPRLNIKTVLSTYGDFHVKDKTAVRTSYL